VCITLQTEPIREIRYIVKHIEWQLKSIRTNIEKICISVLCYNMRTNWRQNREFLLVIIGPTLIHDFLFLKHIFLNDIHDFLSIYVSNKSYYHVNKHGLMNYRNINFFQPLLFNSFNNGTC
jgi:hypothetical protein